MVVVVVWFVRLGQWGVLVLWVVVNVVVVKVTVQVLVAVAGVISLEVWDSEGLGEGEGDVGNGVVGASRECPGRETFRPGRDLLDNVESMWRATHRATAV